MKNFIKIKVNAVVTQNDNDERINIKDISSYGTDYNPVPPITLINLISGRSIHTKLLSAAIDKLIEDAQK